MAYDKDYYAVLQVNRNAKQDDIERAYARLSSMYDPTSSNKKRAAQRHADITAAYNVLRDPRRRRQYDRQLANMAADAGSMSPADVLSNRFVLLGSGAIFLAVLAVLGLVILLGGGDSSDAIVSNTGSPTVLPTPSPTPTAPAAPPSVAATPVTNASGLGYIVVRAGAGVPVAVGDTITVNYSGWLQDTGALFDSTYSGKQPYTFVVGAGIVIKGWDEGVVGMQPGERRRLIIPADLAYGATGHDNPTIPANATLIVDIDLLATGTPTPTPGPTPPPSPPDVTGETTTTATGLQYIIVTPGTGTDVATTGQTITVNYTGWLKDTGALFDSSLKPGRTPFQFPLGAGRVIQAWDEGVAGMKVGETRRLIVPAALGYGAAGSPPIIPANADLIFDITLLSNTATPTPAPATATP
ncbi:MAG: FKBP-type peptidyl-prolyl cis-trans isomerase [Chloroflexota bacterium]